jgi:murein DD-endopeptidase MepM/ murein hydrolase activator NlpD
VAGPASHNNSANGWFEIDYNGTRGYVDGDLLVLLTAPAASASERSASSSASTSTRSGSAPASSATSATAGNQQVVTGTQPGDTDNQIPASSQATQSAGQTPAGQQPTQAPGGEQTATAPAQQPTQAAGQQPAQQPTQTPAAGATEPAQPDDQGEQADTDPTRPWDSTTPTPTATSATTPTPTPTQAPSREVSSAGFIMPVQGATLTQGFGCSSLGFYPYNPDWGCGVHDGVDYAAPSYTPIYAVADGTVVTAGWCDCGLGYYVEIDHGNGVHTIYGHMATQPTVRAGQTVTQGQQIGPMGSTGLSTGPHVHFMVQVNGVSQDPARYLP